jgi:hypothetical protein
MFHIISIVMLCGTSYARVSIFAEKSRCARLVRLPMESITPDVTQYFDFMLKGISTLAHLQSDFGGA